MNMKNNIYSILKEVGAELKKSHGNISSTKKSTSPADVVTELDKWAEKTTKAELAKLDSSIEFVGEEFGGNRDAKKKWLMDPIDGTAHFIRGLPFCTIMLSLIENEIVIESYIYNFILDEMYYAKKNNGAFLNNEAIQVSSSGLEDAYIGYETKYEKIKNQEKFFEFKRKTGALIIKTISSGYEFGLIASGKLDGRIQFDPYGKDYDFAAGTLLVAEAGGVVANIGEKSFDYRNLSSIATNKKIYKALTEDKDAIFPIKNQPKRV